MNRTVKATEAAFWEAFSSFCPPGGYFEARGGAQRELDGRFIDAIDSLLVPKLGRSQESRQWRHEMDVYRSGVHSLIFTAQSFDPEFVTLLQSLLVGEHENYCIVCQVLPAIDRPTASRIGSVAIRENRLLLSYPLVAHLNGRL